MMPNVVAVSLRAGHHFSKLPSMSVRLLRGLGVAGDAHIGASVRHRSRVRKDPTQPNLRQVHLIHTELFDELRAKGFRVGPGELGENITTSGLDLLALPDGQPAACRYDCGRRDHRAARSLHPDRQVSEGIVGGDPGSGRREQSNSQGRRHEHRDIGGRCPPRRSHCPRDAGRTSPTVIAGVTTAHNNNRMVTEIG